MCLSGIVGINLYAFSQASSVERYNGDAKNSEGFCKPGPAAAEASKTAEGPTRHVEIRAFSAN